MKRNGFTLIELLAVIVILAIIALIATPIILGIINDAREESNERSVELYASAVRNAVAAYQLTGTSAPKSFDDLTIQYEGNVECSVEELYEDGSFYLEGCKVNGGEKTYNYGTKVIIPCTLDDKDSNGVASLSDVITCGTESFYVLTNNNKEITMITKYIMDAEYVLNLETGQPEERNNTYLQVTQSSTDNIVMFYTDVPDVINEYQNHLRGDNLNVSSAVVSIPTFELLAEYGCSYSLADSAPHEIFNCANSSYSWLNDFESYVVDKDMKVYSNEGIDAGAPYTPLRTIVTISIDEI